MSVAALVSVVLGVLVLYVTRNALIRKKPLGPLPPGPRPKPILGNISDLPPAGSQDWVHWLKHKDLYGPISSITVMGQTIVIVNDLAIATELLTKRSAIHSSRPTMEFASELVGWKQILGMQPYSSTFRAYRKAMQPYLGSEGAVAENNFLQEVEVQRFLLRTLKDQKNIKQHIRKEAGAVILKIAYGYTIEPHGRDTLVDISNLSLEHFSVGGAPGTWAVDMIPALKYLPDWFPGTGFKQTVKEWKANLHDVVNTPYALVQQQMDEDKYTPSYLSNIFKASGYPKAGSEEETVAKWTAASLYTGGSDTTVSSVETFFLAMTLFPEVQRKAQEEIDRVIGSGQLPKVADRARLPYVSAVVKEVLRWQPVAPMGIPHMSTDDDIWDGYWIPKGTLVMANIWAFTHDPANYHDPMAFKPERFLGVDGREPEMDPSGIVFGFGRRICPGRFLAENTVYLSVAMSLAVFRVSKAVENGVEVDVKPEFQAGVISHPAPWKFEIAPRSAAHEGLILSVEKEHPWEQSDAPALERLKAKAG